MFWRRKKAAWYWKTLLLLLALRVIYAFARFFMKITAKHAGMADVSDDNKK